MACLLAYVKLQCSACHINFANAKTLVQVKYKLKLPEYPGSSQCVVLGKSESKKDPSSMRLNYDVAERQGGLLEEHVDKDPLKQFDRYTTLAC